MLNANEYNDKLIRNSIVDPIKLSESYFRSIEKEIDAGLPISSIEISKFSNEYKYIRSIITLLNSKLNPYGFKIGYQTSCGWYDVYSSHTSTSVYLPISCV